MQILIGNKCDMLDKKVCNILFEMKFHFSDSYRQVIDSARGQALADEYGMKFFETSTKNNIKVEQAFFEMAREVLKRLNEQDAKEGKGPVVKLPQEPEKKSGPCRC